MKFYKMQGAGNDYIYFDCFARPLNQKCNNESDYWAKVAVRLSDRHFGVGGDGIILLCPSRVADVKMRIFNADGSEGKMCGNGVRCLVYLAKYLGYVTQKICTVETLSGIKIVEFIKDNLLRVDMGVPELSPKLIPSSLSGERAVGVPLKTPSGTYSVTLVNMGNPHCVTFTSPDDLNLELIGRQFEFNPIFPDRVNAEFVEVVQKNILKMRVWERGSGETLACGTGACAAAVAAVLNGFCDMGADIKVILRGGELTINYSDRVTMTGPAALVFVGEIDIDHI